jgi:hypothetical protein
VPNDSHIPIVTPSIATPHVNQGVTPLIVDDIVPPNYPEGCELWLMVPGQIQPRVKVNIPLGAILCLIVPDQAVHVRPAIRDTLVKIAQASQREAEQRAKNGVGR